MTLIVRLFLAAICLPLAAWAAPPGAIAWQEYGGAAFAQAKTERRLVLLELEAVWCHWCHVMDAKTWTDPGVAEALARDYVAVRVDHDARPDLAERYREYGWPAIVILDAGGRDLVKRAGYIAPEAMRRLLAAVVRDPTPETGPATTAGTWAETALLAPAVEEELKRRFVASHDYALGGLIGDQKMVDRDATEYALLLAADGDRLGEGIARGNLAAGRRLADPVWGGVYQYSSHGDWDHPHYEKLGALQADYLRMFALGHAALGDPADRAAVAAIHGYLNAFLRSPEGAYYASQDADLRPGENAGAYFALADAERRRLGVPRLDRNLYANVNGLIADALVQAYLATGEAACLDDARRAVAYVIDRRALAGGGFRHGQEDTGGPYLADSLAMLRAFLSLLAATGEPDWLHQARTTADFIDRHFRQADGPGYVGAVPHGPLVPVAAIDENIALARAANLLARYTGEPRYRAMAERAMRYLATPAVALSRISDPGILLAGRELANEPDHLAVVGRRDDPAAIALFQAASRWPVVYKRVDWWDRRDGPPANPDVAYPDLPRSAAYVCSVGRCSRPLFAPADLIGLAGARPER